MDNKSKIITEFYPDGKISSQQFLLNERHHRANGPAITYYFQSGNIDEEFYFTNGILHRVDGPAYIAYLFNGDIANKEYYLNDDQYEDENIIDNWELFCKMQLYR